MILTIVIAATALLLIAGIIFLFTRYVPIIASLFMNVTVRPVPGDPERFEGEDVTFETADGVRLAGTLGPAPEDNPGAPLIVFCPEYSASRHSVMRYAWFLRDAGYRIFTFDFRGHGDSEKPRGYAPSQWITTFEVSDLRAALRYLKGRPDVTTTRIGLFGISRGAVAALVVASEAGAWRPDDVKAPGAILGVVSDGAFSTSLTLHGYMRRWAPIFVDPAMLVFSTPDRIFALFRVLAMKLSEHRLGVRFVELAPALKRLKAPVFFLHGEKDNYIDASQARTLYDHVRCRKELWVIPDADHNEAVDVAPAEYSRRVMRFFHAVLGEKPVRQGLRLR